MKNFLKNVEKTLDKCFNMWYNKNMDGGCAMNDILKQQEEFCTIAKKYIHRSGIDELLDYLRDSDFFCAPASTRYHLSYDGGLVEHSLNVFYSLRDELVYIFGKDWEQRYSMETVAIVSLFHDLCKINRYIKDSKNVKNPETGEWEKVPYFKYNTESFAMGHASHSLHIVQKFMKLTDEECQAIYWHMGPYDLSQYNSMNELSSAYRNNTLAFALNRADMLSTYIVENDRFRIIESDETSD